MNNYKPDASCNPFWCEDVFFDELTLPNDGIGDSDDSGVSERMTNGLTFSPPSQSTDIFGEQLTDSQSSWAPLTQCDSSLLSACTGDPYPANFTSSDVPFVQEQPCHSNPPCEISAEACAQSSSIPSTFLLLPGNALVVSSMPAVSAHHPDSGDSPKMPKYVALAPNSLQAVESNADKLNRSGGTNKQKMSEKQIRNRESARSFRERRKQHFVYMEWKMNELQAENNMLRRENVALKNEISRLLIRVLHVENMQNQYQYSNENAVVPQTKSSAKRRNTAMLAVMMLFFTVNFGPFSTPKSQTPSPSFSKAHNLQSYPVTDPKLVRMRRSRLTGFPSFSKVYNKVDAFEPFPKVRLAAEQPCDTNRYVNNTETLRLTDELNRWAQRHKRNWNIVLRDPGHVGGEFRQGTKNLKNRTKLAKSLFGRYGSHRGPPILQSLKSEGSFRYVVYSCACLERLRSFRADDSNRLNATGIDQFFSSLHWRNDTFYVVSILKVSASALTVYVTDYLILPATAYNRTSRPRMSLIMPAIPYNDTLPMSFEDLAMLQIECEVMNTKLLQFPGQRNPVNSSRLKPQSSSITNRMDNHF
ncbi:hypothetical protein M513_03235 [Trichuris suis]|uniref:BZIP domain-containing protein n=1 Tax=Trichuris suis TaxID=68888 RepID=A0A085MF00_9BILA|nr:hypothetical protein M513_03235 [Trichuris suis]